MTDFNFSGKTSYSILSIDSFGGVDYATNPLDMSLSRSDDAMNIEPAGNGAIKCRHGYEAVLEADGRINGIYSLKELKGDHILVHHGNKLSEWKSHKMCRYVVPDEGLLVDYCFTIGENSYVFTREKLKNTDTSVYYVDTCKLYINGDEQPLVVGNFGTPVHMEATKYIGELPKSYFSSSSSKVVYLKNPNGKSTNDYLKTEVSILSADIPDEGVNVVYNLPEHKLCIGDAEYNLVGSTSASSYITVSAVEYQMSERYVSYLYEKEEVSSTGYLRILLFDDPDNDEYVRRSLLELYLAEIPDEGVLFKYYGSSNMLEYTTKDGKKHKTNMVKTLSSKINYGVGDIWYGRKDWQYEFRPPEGVNYCFTANGKKYYFTHSGLNAGDLIEFDFETEYLYLNDEKIFVQTEEISSQELQIDEFYSELIRLDVTVPDEKSSYTQIDNKLYIFTGTDAYVYGEFDIENSDGKKIDSVYDIRKMEDEAYVPTVVIGSSPIKTVVTTNGHKEQIITESGGGGGKAYENVNLLSDKRIDMFCVNSASDDILTNGTYSGTGTVYRKLQLSVAPIEKVIKVERLSDDGEWIDIGKKSLGSSVDNPYYADFYVDNATGIITFTDALVVTPVTGKDNYRVTYAVSYSGNVEYYAKKYESDEKNAREFKPPSVPERLDYNTKLYKYYIGSNLNQVDGVNVTLFLNKYYDGYGARSYSDDDEDKTYLEDFNTVSIDVGFDSAENSFRLPSGRIAYCVLNRSNDSGFVVEQWHVYTHIVQENDKFYLEISKPYVFGSYYSDSGKRRTVLYEATISSIKIVSRYIGDAYKDRINKATICTKFGYGGNLDRLFVAGWDSMREYEFWSEINNPLYFPDLNYARLGDGDTKIMGWNRVSNNQLAIHKNSNGSDSTVYIQNAVLNSDNSVNFPVTEGASGVGVVSERCFGVLNGEPLALSADGVFATKLVTDIPTDIKYAAPRSYYINPKLKQFNLANAEAVVYDERYYLAVDDFVFVADGSRKSYIGSDDEVCYEWYVWDNLPVRVWFIYENELYFGTADGRICKFNKGYMDIDKPVSCWWSTPQMNFSTQPYYKKIKNVVIACPAPETDFSEISIDYITAKGTKTVKSFLIDNTAKSNAVQSVATNYKLKKVNSMKVRVRADNAEDFRLCNIAVLYTLSGKFKG